MIELPLNFAVRVTAHSGEFSRDVRLQTPFTVLLGPNGSGKTHLLRAIKQTLPSLIGPKKVRFLSAGRLGVLEEYRSDFDGHRAGNPRYDQARYGSKEDAVRRHNTETLFGDFQTLAVRADILVKIQERLRRLFNRELLIDWDAGYLVAKFARVDVPGSPYSSAREASGLMHLVGLLASIYDDEVGALLVDEPEVSLHPQLQAFVLKEMLSVAGVPDVNSNKKLIAIATHSTEMVQIARVEDLTSLLFCYDLAQPPVHVSPDAGELKNKKLQALVARFGQEHKLSLFSRRPLLVEGPSDVIIVSALARKLSLHLEAAGSQLLPVIGKGQMPIVARLMRLLGKSPVVLADADGVADGLELPNEFLANNPAADQHAANLGGSTAIKLSSQVFTDFCELIATRLSEIWPMAETHPYWVQRELREEQLAKQRATFCTLFLLTPERLRSLSADGAWDAMRVRFSVVLDMLEAVGCFVLRKGPIECYFIHSAQSGAIGKPTAAAEEMQRIDLECVKVVEDAYADVIRCARFASRAAAISEASAVRDLVLAIAAPAVARLRAGADEADISACVRAILGDRIALFDLSVEKDALIISLRSKILDIPGMPIRLKKDDDVLRVVNEALFPPE